MAVFTSKPPLGNKLTASATLTTKKERERRLPQPSLVVTRTGIPVDTTAKTLLLSLNAC